VSYSNCRLPWMLLARPVDPLLHSMHQRSASIAKSRLCGRALTEVCGLMAEEIHGARLI
jgi:hypothetical protein